MCATPAPAVLRCHVRGVCVSDFHHANDHWTEQICPAAICTTNHLQGRPSGGCLDPKTKRCVCVLDLWETSDDGRTQAPAHRAAGVCPAFPPGPHQPGCTGSAVGVCRPRGYVFGQPCNASGAESGPVQRRDHGYEDGLFTDRVLRTLAENEGQTQPLLAVWAPHGVHVSAAASFRGRPSQEAAAQYPLQVPPEFFSPFDFMESTDQQPGRSRQLYAAMVSYADTAIGAVATSLRASERWNSTLIVFSAPSISAQICSDCR